MLNTGEVAGLIKAIGCKCEGGGGESSDPTIIIDDTAGSGVTNKVWSADKSSALLTEIDSRAESSMTDAEAGTFDIADDDGNVVFRVKNGNVKTSAFNSEDVAAVEDTLTQSAFDFADNDGFVVLRLKDGHIKTKMFNSAAISFPVEYKFSDDDLLIGFGYNETSDAVVVFNIGRSNDLFDFSSLCLKPKGTSLENLSTSDLTTVWNSGTDMHSPFQFLAVDDPDGYYSSATDPGYTGGNHTQTISSVAVKTASSKYVKYFADGVPISSGYGKCANFEIKWANNVQAYNCVKTDGTGRTSLIEYHDMIFDGIRFNEKVNLVPTEDIKMKFWEGFAFVKWGTIYDHVVFIDATNRTAFVPTDSNIESGNAKTSGIVAWGDDHAVELSVDTNIDLGKRDYYTGTKGAYAATANTKGYFRIIEKTSTLDLVMMDEGEVYTLQGSFRFYPAISE